MSEGGPVGDRGGRPNSAGLPGIFPVSPMASPPLVSRDECKDIVGIVQ